MTNKDKFYVTIPVTQETVRDLGIKPEKIEWHMVGGKLERCLLVEVKSDEKRKAIMRDLWREEKQGQRLRERLISSDALNEHYGHELSAEARIEEVLEEKELVNKLWKVVDELAEFDKKIVLMLSRGYTESQIAEAVNCCQKTINNHKHKVFALLREKLKNFV